jgi:hypothetical protein
VYRGDQASGKDRRAVRHLPRRERFPAYAHVKTGTVAR